VKILNNNEDDIDAEVYDMGYMKYRRCYVIYDICISDIIFIITVYDLIVSMIS
jgi:hypothetical protein